MAENCHVFEKEHDRHVDNIPEQSISMRGVNVDPIVMACYQRCQSRDDP